MRSRSPFALVLALVLAGLMLAPAARAANEIAYQCDPRHLPARPRQPGLRSPTSPTTAQPATTKSRSGRRTARRSPSSVTSPRSGHGERNVFVMDTGGAGPRGQPRHSDHLLQLGEQADRRPRLVAGRQPDRLHARQQRRRRQRLGRQRRRDHDLPARDRRVGRQAAPDLVAGQLEDRLRRRQKRAGTDLRRVLDRRHRPAAGERRRARTELVARRLAGSPSTATTPATSATSTSTSSTPTAAARRWSSLPLRIQSGPSAPGPPTAGGSPTGRPPRAARRSTG